MGPKSNDRREDAEEKAMCRQRQKLESSSHKPRNNTWHYQKLEGRRALPWSLRKARTFAACLILAF